MKNSDFVHLHVHDQYSVLDGYGNAKQYCKRAKELGFKALALTNHGNIDGCIRFQKECKANGIKPIFGAEMYIVPDLEVREKGEKRAHITLLAQNRTGWENICKMLTVANINGFFYRPRIDPELLLDNCEGVIVGSACASSFMRWPRGKGMDLMKQLKDKGCFVYFEIMPIDLDEQRALNNTVADYSEYYNIPLVATNDCHYILKEQNVVQEVLLAIQTKKTWDDPKRWRFTVDTLFLQSVEEMEYYFDKYGGLSPDVYKKAMENTKLISDMCNFELEAIPVVLPDVDIEEYSGMDPNDQFINLCLDGWDYRKNKHPWITEDKYEDYMARLTEEIDIICSLGFASYFLIVYELINWCKQSDIMTGPGRGCFTGDTKISLLDGRELNFLELIDEFGTDTPFWVYSCTKEGVVEQGLGRNPRKTGTAKICVIKLDNGEKIRCTYDHKFLLRNGSYKEASLLRLDDSLMPLYRRPGRKGHEQYRNMKYERWEDTHYLGFQHKKGKVIHHKDLIRTNNDPDNREQISSTKHLSIHNKIRNKSEQSRKRSKLNYHKTLGSKENIQKTIERNKSKEHKKIVSKGQKIKWSDPIYKSEQIKRMESGINSPEALEKRKQMLIKRNQDPEFIAKCKARRKRRKAGNNHKVESVRLTNQVEDVYDIEVEKYHNFALSSGVFVHNSVGGSLVSYCMGITQVDPLKYDLVFSRFISEARIDLPDIDMDFEKSRRGDVIEHLKDKYGEFNVIGISNFLSMKGKSALKDASRVFMIPKTEVEKASDAIITRSGGDMRADFSIVDAFETFEDGIKFKAQYPQVAQLAIDLESQIRGHGRHAAGICISKSDLRNGANCAYAKRGDTLCANWDKKDSEYNGLMKLDILGLQSLDVLHRAQILIKERHGVDIDYEDIELDDVETLEEFNRGNCVGIFQFSGNSIMRFCRDIGVSEFEDIVALNALHRPGTLKSGTIHVYKDRKHGVEPVTYAHPIIEDITKPTQGIILYQEQAMRLMFECGGLPWKTADTIRKAISKSQGEAQMETFHNDFVNGCLKAGTLNKEEADEIFNTLKSFGSYGFNKCISHSTVLKKITTNALKREYTVGELYNIKNDIKYANKNGNKSLRSKYIAQGHYGYGLSLSPDGRVKKNLIIDIQPAGIRKLYKVTLSNGSFIEVTNNHKFPAPFGDERMLSELRIGDSLYYCCKYELEHKHHRKFSFSGKEQRCKGKTYEGKGFPKGKNNPGYIDGSYTKFDKIKLTGFCSKCKTKKNRTERHHKDGNRNNNERPNIIELCSSCHKKADYKLGRTKMGEKGYPTRLIKIKSIEYVGEDMTYDITMDGPNHNFATNQNIITSNSHSVEYSLISYWQMWLRVKYPTEYMVAILSYGQEGNKPDNMQEARRLGLKIQLPDINISDASEWTADFNGNLLIPLTEIKGVGPKAVTSIMSARKNGPFIDEKDFESRVNLRVVNSRVRNLLNITYCWADKTNLDLSESQLDYLSEFFNFSLSNDPMYKYRKLLNKLRTCITIKTISASSPGDIVWGYVDKITYQIKTDGADGIAYSGCYGQLKDEEGNYIMMNFERELYKGMKDEIEHSEGKWVAIRLSQKRDDSVVVAQIWYADDMLKGDFENFVYYGNGAPEKITLLNYPNADIGVLNKPYKEVGEFSPDKNPMDLARCELCEFRQNSVPIYPSPGTQNVMVISEYPTRGDLSKNSVLNNEIFWYGQPQIGALGMADFNLSPNDIWVTSFVKCFPGEKKKPKKKQLNKCTVWLEKEILAVKPFIILAFGNVGLQFFNDKESGIMDASGDIIWNDKFEAFVVNIINPNILFYAPENTELYNRGIMKFIEKYLELGWK